MKQHPSVTWSLCCWSWDVTRCHPHEQHMPVKQASPMLNGTKHVLLNVWFLKEEALRSLLTLKESKLTIFYIAIKSTSIITHNVLVFKRPDCHGSSHQSHRTAPWIFETCGRETYLEREAIRFIVAPHFLPQTIITSFIKCNLPWPAYTSIVL
jgi:hypothetical protein